MGIEATDRAIAANLAQQQEQNLAEPMAPTMAKTRPAIGRKAIAKHDPGQPSIGPLPRQKATANSRAPLLDPPTKCDKARAETNRQAIPQWGGLAMQTNRMAQYAASPGQPIAANGPGRMALSPRNSRPLPSCAAPQIGALQSPATRASQAISDQGLPTRSTVPAPSRARPGDA